MIDQEAFKTFDKLYDSTYQDVLKYVVCHCSHIDDVKDIVQNVYMDVLKKMKNDNSFIISKAYIIGIAKNKVKDYYRHNYKVKLISLFASKDNSQNITLLDTIPSDIDIACEIIKKEDIDLIWDFLKKKNVIISKIFYLYYYTDTNIKEIADELHISESNVKNYLYRTLKELHILMKNRGDKNV